MEEGQLLFEVTEILKVEDVHIISVCLLNVETEIQVSDLHT